MNARPIKASSDSNESQKKLKSTGIQKYQECNEVNFTKFGI